MPMIHRSTVRSAKTDRLLGHYDDDGAGLTKTAAAVSRVRGYISETRLAPVAQNEVCLGWHPVPNVKLDI